MSDCEETRNCCHSIFKDGTSETTAERYTAAWARMIDQLEKTKNEATELPESK